MYAAGDYARYEKKKSPLTRLSGGGGVLVRVPNRGTGVHVHRHTAVFTSVIFLVGSEGRPFLSFSLSSFYASNVKVFKRILVN